ncbi:MAG: lipoate--protein ligase LplA, partial [Candidatus Pacebacteria bacterium]|nr:lipoate--protein ligase LplA [Candidatus Paceibacterota bacterium]
MKQPRVYLSHLNDPFVNLALEEWLVRRHDAEQMILLIYRNSPAVVIGRNQNPWLEHSPQACQASGAVLARRVSGGG